MWALIPILRKVALSSSLLLIHRPAGDDHDELVVAAATGKTFLATDFPSKGLLAKRNKLVILQGCRAYK
jgi:hypothetical protein